MSLSPGTRLGPYEILSAIGAGGMGEVYRAKDTRLGRDVAIKVLPASFADDPERRSRFEREAQALAALSHPNVIAIFDTGIHDPSTGSGQAAQLYVVMELLAGQTLRERLRPERGAERAEVARVGVGPHSQLNEQIALPVRKAVDIAVQIARGLGAAHGKGIVHRDLKPENIFLLEDGQVKILDFGLARQAAADHSGATQTMAATGAGTVMGTVGYMAPEQVRGQVVDARADVFALGAVLYEMVSGQRAYQRDTAADTMTAILTQDPPELVGSRPDLSPALDRIIRHCLEKNANERFQNARDVAFALEALSGTAISHQSGAVPAAPGQRSRRRWLWPAATAAAIIASGFGGMLIEGMSRDDATEIQFQAKTWESQWVTSARFAPDGQTIVYSAARTGNLPSLYVIRPGDVASQLVAGPGTQLLSVSSKGELAVLTGAKLTAGHRVYSGTLARMTMTGAARPWLEGVSEADWSPDGTSVAVIREDNSQWRLEYPAGHVLYTLKSGYLSDPRVSPDGTAVAFFEHELVGDDRGWVKVVNMSGAVKTLAGEYWGEEGIAWSLTDKGQLFFAAAEAGQSAYGVIAVNTTGTPRTRHTFNGASAVTIFDTAADGRLLTIKEDLRSSIRALVPGEAAEREFSWLDFSHGGYLSRDNKRLAFTDLSQSAGANYAAALRDTADSPVVRLGEGFVMGMSPDAKWVAAVIPSTGLLALYPTGPGEPIKLNQITVTADRALAWFSDSRRIIACGQARDQPSRCYEIAISGGAAKPVTPDGFKSALLADDDRTMLVSTTAGEFKILTVGGTDAADTRGMTSNDTPLAWSADRKSVVVADKTVFPKLIERVDLASGKRTTLKTLTPPDSSGVNQVTPYQWIGDGRGYVYTYERELSQLLVVTGVRR